MPEATPTTDALTHVKCALNIKSDFQDEALAEFIAEVRAYLKDAGVAEGVLDSEAAHGVIVRGVIDLWNYGASEVKFSEYFMQRVIQLASSEVDSEDLQS